MDIVLSRLQNTNITPHAGDNQTNFDGLYKNWGRLGNQEERRREILEVQKTNRNTKLDKYRGILQLVQAVNEHNIWRDQHRAYYRPSIYVAGFNKAPSYSEVLMMSEWLIEKPSDFETNWMVVPSPKGTRTLIVASNGITRLYTKYGYLMFECRTGLPGGNPSDPRSKVNCCVLDGFYQKKTNVLYILDILAWNSHSMTDGEFEFRDYWMRTQLAVLREIRSINNRNELNFNLLPKVSCAPESFNKFMQKIHFKEDITSLDGLLFFHKQAHYFSGETPLVGWLFPYMLPEVLGSDIIVNPAYMLQKPANYTNQADFITEFNAKMEKKTSKARSASRRNSARDNQMDTAEVKPETKSSAAKNDFTTNNESEEISETSAAAEVAMVAESLERKTENMTKKESMDAETIATKDQTSMEAETIDNKEKKGIPKE